MIIKYSLSLCCFLLTFSAYGQTASIQTRLGYPENSKLLILHADDLGVSHSENIASIAALERGPVNSASIMVPCPWFPEIATYARKNSDKDLGIHLTLTSEWDYYKWGAVSSKDAVPGLLNQDGYFYSQVDSLGMYGKAKEVAIELRNQVKKAYQCGIDITHLDTHMGAAVIKPEYLEVYLKLGREFKLPVLLDKRIYQIDNPAITHLIDDNTVVVDNIYGASPADYEKGMAQYYTSVLKNLKPGLHCILVHLAYNDEEMQAVTIDHPYWNAKWRQADMDYFTGQECQEILKAENIILVSWRELRDKITRAQ